MKRLVRLLRDYAVMFLAVLSAELITRGCGAQDSPKHALRASVRPNDSVKADPSLPWVAEYQAPAVYEDWWKEIAACEHLPHPGQLTKAIRWVEVNSVTFRLGRLIEQIYGFTDPTNLTIYIAQPSVMDAEIVKHEMLHQIHWWMGFDEGEDFHPPDSYESCHLHRFHQ